ncbi:Ig-like domain-containing protein [Pedobacter sp. JCM 36344]|uniref:Ig-like domain-containing protein n=1 Tax=Pedobacter sp. JCM 36344 TaxID=3374280 RepID=UPI00397E5A4B
MNNQSIRPRLTYALVITSVILIIYGCASIQTPQGGPRDTKPPEIVSMTPKNLTTNFIAKKILIEFNEYFKIENEVKEFSISPELGVAPTLKVKQKRLEITFTDTLENNTTYTLNFGKSIADINESNAIKNLTYVFATGPVLDSLSIKGRVTNTKTGKPELDAIAFILPINRDTLLGKGKPAIYTRTDSNGNYALNNLRKDTYRVYALKESNGDKIYQQPTDEIGFIKDSINLTKNLDSINIALFKEDALTFRLLSRKLEKDGSLSFAFNQKLKNPEVVVLEPSNLDVSKKFKFSKYHDSLQVWLSDLSFDSTKISIRDDGKLLQTTTITRGKKETYTRTLTATGNLEGTNLNPNKPLRLTFNFPVDSVYTNKITLLEDSIAVTNFTINKDSADFLSYYLRYPWKAKRSYDIKYGAGAFTGIFTTRNKEFKQNFTLGSKEDYGTLIAKIMVPEKNRSYILDVLNENNVSINNIILTQDTTVTLRNYRSGKYFLRITYDSNKNGIWDTGNVFKRLQPERIWNEPVEMSIKANWDRNVNVKIPKEQ